MNPMNPRVCPACRKPARNRPLPPEGFWQVYVLQRIGMYPYRCEACGVRFYRKVPVGQGLGEGRFPRPPHRPYAEGASGMVGRARGSTSRASSPDSREPRPPKEEIPKVVAPPEATGDSLTHRDFTELIDQISRAETRRGLKARNERKDEDV